MKRSFWDLLGEALMAPAIWFCLLGRHGLNLNAEDWKRTFSGRRH